MILNARVDAVYSRASFSDEKRRVRIKFLSDENIGNFEDITVISDSLEVDDKLIVELSKQTSAATRAAV